MPPQDVIADLRALAARTGTPDGAQRLAWGPVWRDARAWFRDKVAELGLQVTTDAAGNNWVTLPGESRDTVIVGGHLDSVPNGGWLDGALGVTAGLEALRMFSARRPPRTLAVVDWADEEGARFGRSLLGSSAAGGSLNVEDVRALVDREGTKLVDALAENGVSLDRMRAAHASLKAIPARAYLELHIEQGPVLESLNKPEVSSSGRLAWSATCSGLSDRPRIPARRRSRCGAMPFSPPRRRRWPAAGSPFVTRSQAPVSSAPSVS